MQTFERDDDVVWVLLCGSHASGTTKTVLLLLPTNEALAETYECSSSLRRPKIGLLVDICEHLETVASGFEDT